MGRHKLILTEEQREERDEARRKYLFEYQRDNRHKYKAIAKDCHLRAKYGIDLRYFNAMLSNQGNECAICKVDFTGIRPYVDHCHTTGKVRALLCHGCNTAVGMVKENTATLYRMIEYIEFHNKPLMKIA